MSTRKHKNAKDFEKGNKQAHGGKRDGSGRKPNAFRELCSRFTDKHLLAFAERVLAGEKLEPRLSEGQVVYTEASVDSKTYLLCRIAEWGHGKAVQTNEVTGKDGQPLGVVILPPDNMGEAGKVC